MAAGSAVALSAAGCAPVVDVDPAANANDPACADVMVYLPETLSGLPRRETNSQATAAWGDPSAIVLRCGAGTPSTVSTQPCVSANGVDWLAAEGDDHWTLTTYGRTPAVEVLFDPNAVPSSNVLPELAASVGRIPAQEECLSTQRETDFR